MEDRLALLSGSLSRAQDGGRENGEAGNRTAGEEERERKQATEETGGDCRAVFGCPFPPPGCQYLVSLEFSPQGGLPLLLGAALIGRKFGSTGMGERAKGSGLGHLNRKTLPPGIHTQPAAQAAVSSCGLAPCSALGQGTPRRARGYRLPLGVSPNSLLPQFLSTCLFSSLLPPGPALLTDQAKCNFVTLWPTCRGSKATSVPAYSLT